MLAFIIHTAHPVMNDPAKNKATYEDILALPENLVGEILYGQLHTHPLPSPRHARAYSPLGGNQCP